MSPLPVWYSTLIYLLIILQLGGGCIALARWKRLSVTYRLAASWLVWTGLAAVVYRVTPTAHEKMQYVAQMWYPISGCLSLWAMSTLLHRRYLRTAVQAIALVYLGVSLSLLFDIRRVGDHFRLAGTLHAAALFAAGLPMIAIRAVRARVDLLNDSAFLAGAAFLLVGAGGGFVAMMRFWSSFPSADLLVQLLGARNLLQVVAALFLLRGAWSDMRSPLRSR